MDFRIQGDSKMTREEALNALDDIERQIKPFLFKEDEVFKTIRQALAAEEAEVSNTIHEQQIYNSMMYATKKFIDDLRLKGIIIIKEKSDE